jgi:hypothetical protein
MKTWLPVSLGAVLLVPLQAQENNRLILDFGAGFTEPVGATGRSLDPGWNIRGGVGVNFSPLVGAIVQLDYDSLGINSSTLSNIGFPGGDVHVFSATLDPIVHLTPHKRYDVYLIGGGGMYRRTQEFTQPGVATGLGYNPFFGFYNFGIPTTDVLASYTVVKPGVNGGMGIGLGSKWGGKFYAEARYHRIFMGNGYHTDYVPVSFGFRW